MFIDKVNEAPQLITFADLYLRPGKTTTNPENISLRSHVTKNITLRRPFVSSPMDTVTEAEMAIAMARSGGVGVLHRNCSIEQEVAMAKKVKRAESFIIDEVVTIKADITIKEAKLTMDMNSISGLPVINDNEEVIGILTKRDVRFASDDSIVSEMMSKDLVTAGKNISIEQAKSLLHKRRIEKLIITENDKLHGLLTVKDLERRGKFPLATRDEEEKLVVGAAIGPFDEKRALALDPYVDFILVDLAHGHNMNAMQSAAKISEKISAELVYGSLGSVESVEDVSSTIDNVAGLRVGIGSGAICSTSVVTKASSPTLFSTMQVASAVKELGLNIPVISDGGINNAGDGALCFAVGGSTIMMGSLFAGTRESPGQLLAIEGKMMKSYRGMGSNAAKSVRYALDRYSKPSKSIPEGVEGYVPFRGNVRDVMDELTSGLQAAFGYAGAGSVTEMWSNAKLGKISSQGIRETKPHDIYPNVNTSNYSIN
ncbi:MAG: IMP dehydrogenase [Candidatus Heimdallarchaeota archaeon]|nr:IMP dehydrogenase [Candidatus Heimdallarchaeota archaeon]